MCINMQQDRLPWKCRMQWIRRKVPWYAHDVVPRFVVIVLREIIFLVFVAFKEVQVSAVRFRDLMWWNLLRWIMAIFVSAIIHYSICISSDEDRRAWKRCTKSRVSASWWLPWSTDPSHMSMMLVNNPINHGWKEEDGKLLPIWTTLPLAKDFLHLYVKCTWPITCSQCKCMKTKLKCTHLCKFTCMREVAGLE